MSRVFSLKRKIYNKLQTMRDDLAFFFFLKKHRIRVMSSSQTIRFLQENKCSVARFGDGELNMILGEKSIGFQRYDPALSAKLRNVLLEEDPNLLLCLPHVFSRFCGETLLAKDFWKAFLRSNLARIHSMLREYRMTRYCFGDTQMSRPYMDYTVKARKNAGKQYSGLKALWAGRDIMIVEGVSTRMGIGNDLFADATSIKRIVCPSENAFDCYDRIYEAVVRNHSDELVLIALGPTATVLAAALTKKGIQALDVGHLDIEYEWYKSGANKKTAIDGKYVNEVADGRVLDGACDSLCESQMIAKIARSE